MEAASALRQWRRLKIPNTTIRVLLSAIAEERQAAAMVDTWPTIGEDRAALAAMADHLALLAHSIDSLSPHAKAEFATACLRAFRTPAGPEAAGLNALAAAIRARLDTMPEQDRRRSHASLVARVAIIVAPLGIKPSVSENSKFYRLCAGAFAIAGIRTRPPKTESSKKRSAAPPSPAASIRAYLERARVTKASLESGAKIT
jgi:hypothetical protein